MAQNWWESSPLAEDDKWWASSPLASEKKRDRGLIEDVKDVGTALVEGVPSLGRRLKAAGQAVIGDLTGVEATAKAEREAATTSNAGALATFKEDLAQRRQSSDGSWSQAAKNVGGAIAETPAALPQLVAEQAPNAAVTLGAGAAGFKAGMAAAPFLGPLAPLGPIAGGLLGLWLGNTAVETGGKAIEKAEGGFTPTERGETLREGAVKGAVVTGVDAITFGATKLLYSPVGKAMEKAGTDALVRSGVDVTARESVEAALKDTAIRESVEAAQIAALKQANAGGRGAARGTGAFGLQTVGEGAGEGFGEYAATGEVDPTDVLLESVAGAGQSAIEIGIAKSGRGAKGLIDGARTPPPDPDTELNRALDRVESARNEVFLGTSDGKETIANIVSAPDLGAAIDAAEASVPSMADMLQQKRQTGAEAARLAMGEVLASATDQRTPEQIMADAEQRSQAAIAGVQAELGMGPAAAVGGRTAEQIVADFETKRAAAIAELQGSPTSGAVSPVDFEAKRKAAAERAIGEMGDSLPRFRYSPQMQGNKEQAPSTEPDLVGAYVQQMRETNTPAARAFVQLFDSGRITPADVSNTIARQNPENMAPAAPVLPQMGTAVPAQGIQVERSGARPAPSLDLKNPESAVAERAAAGAAARDATPELTQQRLEAASAEGQRQAPMEPVQAGQYIAALRLENTPQARALVQEYEAGRVNDQDIADAVNAQRRYQLGGQDLTQARLETAAGQAPGPATNVQVERSGARAASPALTEAVQMYGSLPLTARDQTVEGASERLTRATAQAPKTPESLLQVETQPEPRGAFLGRNTAIRQGNEALDQAAQQRGGERMSAPRPTLINGRAPASYTDQQLQALVQDQSIPAVSRRGAQTELAARQLEQRAAEPTAAAAAPGTVSPGGIILASEQRTEAEATQQGKPVSSLGNITTVDPATLPNQSRAQPGAMSRQTHRMVSLLGSMFGKKVVVFDSDNDAAPDGFVRRGDSRTIYLNRKSEISHLVVFGHELLHQLKADNPQAYAALVKVIKLEAGVDTNVPGIRGDMEELTADIVGNRFREVEFWQDVFREILASGKDTKVSQRSAMKLGASVVRAVDRMVKALKGMTGFNTDKMVSNLQEVKSAVTKALASYAQEKRGEATELIRQEVAGQQAPAADTTGEVVASDKRQVNTPEFKRWFGESKVVDGRGRPLVVYHGTHRDFSVFAGSKFWAGGSFFTPNAKLANMFAAGDGGQVMPVYLAIQNPKEIDGKTLKSLYDLEELVDKAKSDGFDGVVVRGMRDMGVKADQWVAFRPEQIKSAIGNSGAFDPNNPDIRKSEKRGRLDNVEAYRYGKTARTFVNGSSFGAGLKGSSRDLYMNAEDKRLKQRVYFYFDKGTGINPEAGVGPIPHRAFLNNVYDADADPQKLVAGNQLKTESNILDAGFDGYLNRLGGTQSGQVIMFGLKPIPVEALQPGQKVRSGAKLEPLKTSAPAWTTQSSSGNKSMLEQKLARMQDNPSWASYDMQIVGTTPGMYELQTKLKADVLASEKRQVNTPEFKRWFGESKVVDGRGRPLVVYHGTDKDFSAFDPERIGDNFGVDEEGFFFTDSIVRASGYADPGSEFAAAGMGMDRNAEPRAGANVMPVFLSIKNPLTLEAYTEAFYTNPQVEIDEQGISLTDYFDDNRKSVIEFVKRGGHDGVVFQHKGKTLAVALRPEQIKSATGNSGAFDPNNPDIRKSEKRILLNIGLSTQEMRGGGMLTEDVVRSALAKLGLKVDSMPVHPSDTEPTAVPAIDRPLTQEEGDDLSARLNQEAIVQRMPDGSGMLFGPKADEWGPYNPAYFVMADGKYAIEYEIQASAKRKRLDPEVVQTLGRHIRNLLPDEKAKLRRDTAQKMVDIIEGLPQASEMAAVAYAGRAKRGWYYNSAQAIEQVFGGDGPRFAALLAALSPQTSVESNLYNTLATWKNWVQAGRPTDRDTIVSIMGRSVQGSGTEASALDAWKNNAVRALTANDPSSVTISGPKVNSFMLNLRGYVDEVTNDAWMANYALVDQKIFSGKLNAAGTDPGKTPGYLAMSARVREAAKVLSRLTGETWTPAEVQETVWSWAKTLYESASVDKSAADIVRNKEITDELIRATPDFRTLFNTDVNERLLRDAGLGDQVERLRAGGDLGGAGQQGAATGGQAAPFAADAQQRYELRAARRLDRLREQRAAGDEVVTSEKREVASLFKDLQESRGLGRVRALERVDAHPLGATIRQIDADFLDILDRLDTAGLVKINCK